MYPNGSPNLNRSIFLTYILVWSEFKTLEHNIYETITLIYCKKSVKRIDTVCSTPPSALPFIYMRQNYQRMSVRYTFNPFYKQNTIWTVLVEFIRFGSVWCVSRINHLMRAIIADRQPYTCVMLLDSILIFYSVTLYAKVYQRTKKGRSTRKHRIQTTSESIYVYVYTTNKLVSRFRFYMRYVQSRKLCLMAIKTISKSNERRNEYLGESVYYCNNVHIIYILFLCILNANVIFHLRKGAAKLFRILFVEHTISRIAFNFQWIVNSLQAK